MSQPLQINSSRPLNEVLKVFPGCSCWMSSKELTIESGTSFSLVAEWISRLNQAKEKESRAEGWEEESGWSCYHTATPGLKMDRMGQRHQSNTHNAADTHIHTRVKPNSSYPIYMPIWRELYLFIHFSATHKGRCRCSVISISLLIYLSVSSALSLLLLSSSVFPSM